MVVIALLHSYSRALVYSCVESAGASFARRPGQFALVPVFHSLLLCLKLYKLGRRLYKALRNAQEMKRMENEILRRLKRRLLRCSIETGSSILRGSILGGSLILIGCALFATPIDWLASIA